MKIVFSDQYDIGFYGLDKLHPFDTQKYSRAWKWLRFILNGSGVVSAEELLIRPPSPISEEELLAVHSQQYLDRLRDPAYVAQAVEVPMLRQMPAWMIDPFVLRPMRWGTRGTMVAAEAALKSGLAVNLSGGYHHAKPAQGEGFCLYADIPLAIGHLRTTNKLSADDRVVCVDLDAHQGNGIAHCLLNDSRTFLFDMYNPRIYPSYDREARERVDCLVPLPAGCGDGEYLDLLRTRLPGFLDSVGSTRPIRLAIYNAGADIYAGDALGGLNVSAAGVIERDRFVISQLTQRNIPTVMVLSGGYSQESHQMIADSLAAMVQQGPY